eukprot:GDKI01033222.1.p1 GENE.GDKI01033222.1~~GDKI01033222.1.p1  ORF type:complete len:280 (-),score=14.99 GDKI01033222.1:183-962(-)
MQGGHAAGEAVRGGFWSALWRKVRDDSLNQIHVVRMIICSVWFAYSVDLMWETRHVTCTTHLSYWAICLLLLQITVAVVAIDPRHPPAVVEKRTDNASNIMVLFYFVGCFLFSPSECDPAVLKNSLWLWRLMTTLLVSPFVYIFGEFIFYRGREFIRLYNDLSMRRAAGLRILGKLKTVKHSELPSTPTADGEGVPTECAICCADFEPQDTVMPLPCHFKHTFHESCLAKWLRKSEICPTCQRNINTTLEAESARVKAD